MYLILQHLNLQNSFFMTEGRFRLEYAEIRFTQICINARGDVWNLRDYILYFTHGSG